jgi:DNA-binding transcriptional regulator YhcF (GntR family)
MKPNTKHLKGAPKKGPPKKSSAGTKGSLKPETRPLEAQVDEPVTLAGGPGRAPAVSVPPGAVQAEPAAAASEAPTAPEEDIEAVAGAPAKKKVQALKQLEEKWGKPLIAAGWVALPQIILEKQRALDLSSLDINIILHIAKYWWDADKLPHPSKNTIAEAIGVEPRTVQRRIAALEAANFIKRIQRPGGAGKASQTALYDLRGLIEAATPFAVEKKEARDAKLKEDVERVRRRRARVASGDGGDN